jgi:cation diffusion facilitator CzcD-associated flavoprotein CzcO
MNAEHVDVLIVGAGLSGVGAAAQVRERLPRKSVAVLEARDAMGGTWDLFRYPGIRSDSDMFTFGYKWRPWRSDTALADGELIREYIHTVAREYGVDRLVRYRHRVRRADWDSAAQRWDVTVEVTSEDGTTAEQRMTAGFLWGCAGYYRYDEGFQPTWPGMEEYAGTIVHPQHWPADLDYAGKRVVVVGSGATAVTLVPAMAGGEGAAEHVTMLQRTPTYILSRPARDPIARALAKRKVPWRVVYPVARWANILQAVAFYQLSMRWPERMKAFIAKETIKQLPADVPHDPHFVPPYNPWDQRLCFVPDSDLFRALRAGTASVETGTIETFTEKGVRLASGRELDADVVITATGFQLLVPFGGIEVSVDGEPVDYGDRLAYKTMMLSGVPNMAFTIGYTNASWTLKADLVIDYVCRLLAYLDRHGHTSATPVADDDVQRRPLLDFHPGYVERAVHLLPSQGDRAPWQLDQNYLKDRVAIQRGRIDDGVLRFA